MREADMAAIEYSIGTYYDEPEQMHRFFAIEDGERIGELYVDIAREIIMQVEVNPDRRGEGIARALYEAADARLSNLRHAPSLARTPEGDCFAEAVGGAVADESEMPELASALADLDID